jgi:L-2-hydroxyglutarate oxidase LhgO
MTDIDVLDVLIVGGGVVGLAAAAASARDDRNVAVLDRHRRPGMETSTHNSGVIHAGLYYPANSLKARLCVEGRARLYEFCERRGVPHARTGKLVVATEPGDEARLTQLEARARANGVDDVRLVGREDIVARQPGLAATTALFSPSTGLVAADHLVQALLQECRDRDVSWIPGTAVTDGMRTGGSIEVRTGQETIRARVVINAAGLHADDVSSALGGETFTIYPCRGEYAELTPRWRDRIRVPVYPVPHASGHGLGVHITPTIGGGVLLGPTVRFQDRKDDYEGDRLELSDFLEPARALLPDITLDDLRPGGSGIRAKFHPPEESFADFHITHDARVPGLIQAAGIDSPGLTSCLAIGAMVAALVDEALG